MLIYPFIWSWIVWYSAIIQRWEFIKENKKVRKQEKKKVNKNSSRVLVFFLFLLVFLVAFLVEFLFSCSLLSCFLINSHLRYVGLLIFMTVLIGSVTSVWPLLSICMSVGLSFFHDFLKGRKAKLQCSYRSTCSSRKPSRSSSRWSSSASSSFRCCQP